jgi:hypothetical protein
MFAVGGAIGADDTMVGPKIVPRANKAVASGSFPTIVSSIVKHCFSKTGKL